MNRRQFIKTMLPIGVIGTTFGLKEFGKLGSSLSSTEEYPMLFLGHGSPMNAIEENQFVQGFRKVAEQLPTPVAILCVSAHWETKGTKVTAMEQPKTIHDFGGFPKELYEVQYPAPGSPEIAGEIQKLVTRKHIELDHHWGLDHGAWSVIKHLYPKATIPVLQLSIDYTMSAQQHFELAKELRILRKKGILVIGSGNMVHNLRMVAWDKFQERDFGFDWAKEASTFFKKNILDKNFKELIDYKAKGQAVQMAIPTPEHYLPLIYTLGLTNEKESIELFNDEYVAGSLTMTSVKFG